MKTLGEKAKINRLNSAFEYWFSKYDDVAEWWGCDDPLIYLFNIPTDDHNYGTYRMEVDDYGKVSLYRKSYCNTLLQASVTNGYRFCGTWEK